MGEEKNWSHNQAYMKQEGDDGHHRMSSHILRGKRRDPMQDGAQAILQTHVGENKFLFLVDQHDQTQQSVKAATDKNDESNPQQRTTYKSIDIMHFTPPRL